MEAHRGPSEGLWDLRRPDIFAGEPAAFSLSALYRLKTDRNTVKESPVRLSWRRRCQDPIARRPG